MKSPKEAMASVVAYEVSDYLVVDPSEIESKLLTDTKIVLNNAQLKPFVSQLEGGHDATVTGSIENVAFTWAWNFPTRHRRKKKEHIDESHPSGGWVKDAVLTIKGMKINAKITCNEEKEETSATSEDTEQSAESASEDVGRITEYKYKQEQNVMDVLTLDLVDFKFTVEMPAPKGKGEKQDDNGSSLNERTLSIVLGGKSVQLETFGKDEKENGKNVTLDQRLTVDSLMAKVVASELASSSNQSKSVTYPLMDPPFSYSARITRFAGTRFYGMTTGLNFVGQPIASAVEALLSDGAENGIVIHAGEVQTQALLELGQAVYGFSASNETGSESDVSYKNRPEESTTRQVADGNVTKNQDKEMNDNRKSEKEKTIHAADSSNTEKQDLESVDTADPPSSFRIPISSVTLLSMDEAKVVLKSVDVTYKADGTVENIEVERFERESTAPKDSDHPCVSAKLSGIHISACPTVVLKVDKVESLSVPGVIELTKELDGPMVVTYEDDTLLVKLESIEATVYKHDDATAIEDETHSKPPEKHHFKTCHQKKHKASEHDTTTQVHTSDSTKKDTSQASVPYHETPSEPPKKHHFKTRHQKKHESSDPDTSTQKSTQVLPTGNAEKDASETRVLYPMCLSLQDLKLTMASDGSIMQMNGINFKIRPDHSGCTVNFRMGGFKNDLLQFQKASSTALVSLDQPNTIQHFKFDAHSIHVTSGFSVQDWYDTLEAIINLKYFFLLLRPPEEWAKEWSNLDPSKKAVVKMPFAEIASLNVHIACTGAKVSIKETAVVIEPFHGNAETTMKDIVHFFMLSCSSRVPSFISNAEILHINVVKQGAALTAATVAADAIDDFAAAGVAGHAAGGAAGIVAMVAVDETKRMLAIGKETRGATSEDRYKPGDLIRGALHLPHVIAHKGALRLGKKDEESSKVEDLAVGVVSDVGDYVVTHRKKLAVAGMGGVGVIFGTAIGGPVGGIVVGLAASAGTAVSIEVIDRVWKKAKERMDDDLANADPTESSGDKAQSAESSS